MNIKKFAQDNTCTKTYATATKNSKRKITCQEFDWGDYFTAHEELTLTIN
jgi:hypothetical protein